MIIRKDICYSSYRDESHKINLYLPEGKCKALLLYLHGGGFVEGNRDLDSMPDFAKDMTDAGIAIASAEYRMYPEAKYPDFIEDAAEAAAYTKRELLPLVECEKLFVCGTSAGAYLSMMLCFDERWLGKYGLTANDMDGFIHDAGQPTVHFNVLKERGIDSRRIIVDDSAPLYHVGKNTDYPPMQIIVSDNDMENRLEETELLVGTLRRFGYGADKVTYTKTHGTHVWYVRHTDDNGHNEFAKILLPFIKENLS